jgi:hypothetical protein
MVPPSAHGKLPDDPGLVPSGTSLWRVPADSLFVQPRFSVFTGSYSRIVHLSLGWYRRIPKYLETDEHQSTSKESL